MRVSGVVERIELIPETDDERQALQLILDKSGLIYWGDAGDHLDPPEMKMGLILNTAQSTDAAGNPAS